MSFASSGVDCTVQQMNKTANKCFGGAARMQSFIKQVRAQYNNTLLIDRFEISLDFPLFLSIFAWVSVETITGARFGSARSLGKLLTSISLTLDVRKCFKVAHSHFACSRRNQRADDAWATGSADWFNGPQFLANYINQLGPSKRFQLRFG